MIFPYKTKLLYTTTIRILYEFLLVKIVCFENFKI
jgi:hypothetical protein